MSYSNMNSDVNINVVVDSRNRIPTSISSTNFRYSFMGRVDRVKKVGIAMVSIPFSFYTINVNNNVLTFNSGAQSITIVPGNYNGNTLASAISTAMAAVFAGETPVATFSTGTYRLTISKTNAFVVDSETDVPTSTLSTFIGFSVSSASSASVTGDTPINISGPSYIVLRSNYLTKYLNYKTLYSNISYANALAIIPVNSAPGGIISFSQPFSLTYANKLNISPTDIVDFSLSDDRGNNLDLNGLDFSLNLIFTIT